MMVLVFTFHWIIDSHSHSSHWTTATPHSTHLNCSLIIKIRITFIGKVYLHTQGIWPLYLIAFNTYVFWIMNTFCPVFQLSYWRQLPPTAFVLPLWQHVSHHCLRSAAALGDNMDRTSQHSSSGRTPIPPQDDLDMEEAADQDYDLDRDQECMSEEAAPISRGAELKVEDVRKGRGGERRGGGMVLTCQHALLWCYLKSPHSPHHLGRTITLTFLAASTWSLWW